MHEIIDLNECRDREHAHERLIEIADEIHRLVQRRLTADNIERLKALHVELGERINAIDPTR